MLGIGMQEMLLIGLAALLLFGPGKLPEVMSQAGKWYKQFRDITADLTGEFNKTVAEAKGELDGLGIDLGPMQKQVNSISKSVQKDLSGTSGSRSTSTAKKTTTSSSSAKKTGTSSTSASKSTTSRATTGSKSAVTNKSATSSKPSVTKPKPVVIASKEDPMAGVSLFEQAERKPRRRARSATPSAFTDLTPRVEDVVEETAASVAAEQKAPITFDHNDPLARARQRRLKAGYAQATA
jgi:TatA/E family protein of Tat protein translocase